MYSSVTWIFVDKVWPLIELKDLNFRPDGRFVGEMFLIVHFVLMHRMIIRRGTITVMKCSLLLSGTADFDLRATP